MKVLYAAMLAALITACDLEKAIKSSEGRELTVDYVEGVQYYSGFRRLAVAYNTDGSIKLCGNEK